MFLGRFRRLQHVAHVGGMLGGFVHVAASLIRPRACLGQPELDQRLCFLVRLILVHHGKQTVRLLFGRGGAHHARSPEQASVPGGNLPCLAGFEFLPQALGGLEVLNHPAVTQQHSHHGPQLVAAMDQFTCHPGPLAPVRHRPGPRHAVDGRHHDAEAAVRVRRQKLQGTMPVPDHKALCPASQACGHGRSPHGLYIQKGTEQTYGIEGIGLCL